MTNKPPLFFIHGMWSTPHVWREMRDHFEARGYSTHAPALPFHDVPPDAPPAPELAAIGVDDYADFLAAEARSAPDSPVVIGHSMGATLAQIVAARIQPRAIVLLSPAATAKTVRAEASTLKTLAGVVSTWGWWRQPARLDRDRALWGIFNEVPADVAAREADALVWDSGRVLFQMAMPWADGAKATRVDYGLLKMPALVVVGERERMTSLGTARATARRLQGNVDYQELPGVGHWLFHEPVRGRVIAAMEHFLERLAPAAR